MVLLRSTSFLGNEFKTRDDVADGLRGLLDPLEPHTSSGGALITLSSSATHYDLRACQLEAFARPLWGLASLLAGGGSYAGVERWIHGLASGTDPEGDEYWGSSRGKDQRMVEMCPIGYALCLCSEQLLGPLNDKQKQDVGRWLGSINDKPMPDTNWLWFRVFANLALRSMGAPEFNETRMKADLDHLDTFQLRGDESGWSRDGPEGVKQIDYYSGSFAIASAMLVYSKIAQEFDPERCAGYRKRMLKFALDQVYYFDDAGRCIPFGRSMIYRFAVVSTFSFLPLAFDGKTPETSLPADYALSWGHIKGIVLRHLRFWGKQQDIFRSDGTLNIGYMYENAVMTENYNGFGSPYWCTKAFACLAAPGDHPFWKSDELAWPADKFEAIHPLIDPLHIMIRTKPLNPSIPSHTFLLSSGQSCHYALKHAEAKYGKFAYSSSFGFSCQTGAFGLEQLAADSMIALCDDPIEDGFGQGERWRMRRLPLDARIERFGKASHEICLRSSWKPWPDVEVESWLLPPSPEAPSWYTRVHRLRTGRDLRSSEAGWGIYGQAKDGRALVQTFSGETSEGGLEASRVARAQTEAGVVGVIDLSGSGEGRTGKIIQADANSNIVFSRSVMPSLLGSHAASDKDYWLVTAVFGLPVAYGAKDLPEGWEAEWHAKPSVPESLKRDLMS